MLKNAKDISLWFIKNNADCAFPSLNGHLKLQKLLYYTQAMSLVVKESPAFPNRIEAWENGPVVPEMFVEYRHNGLVETSGQYPISEFDTETEKIFNIVNNIYGTQSSKQLVDLTHSEEPWNELADQANNRLNPIISQERIREYYQPLKDLYEIYQDVDFSSEISESINGNVFTYNFNETILTEDDMRTLWSLGDDCSGEKYFVYKDEENELVIY